MWQDILHANFSWVAVSLFMAFAGYISRALRWRILIQAAGYSPTKLNTILATFIAYFANIAFPRIGEVTRCGVLNRKEKIPVDKLLGTVVIERVFDLLVLCLALSITVIAKHDFFGSFFYQKVYLPLGGSISHLFSNGFILITIGVFMSISIGVIFFLRKKILQSTIYCKLATFVGGLRKGMLSILHLKHKWLFIIHTLFIWLMYWGMTYALVFSLEQTKNLGPFDALFLLVAGGIGMAAPVQNGYGAFHWITSQALILYGIEESTGIVWATINHESQTLLVLILGTLATIAISFTLKRKSNVTGRRPDNIVRKSNTNQK